MLLIGSKALSYICPDLLEREPRDYDFIAKHDEFRSLVRANRFSSVTPRDAGAKMVCLGGPKPIELEIAWGGTSSELLLSVEPFMYVDIPELGLKDVGVPDLNVLFALKASHKHKKNSPHFLKTMKDYKAMRAVGATIDERLSDFYKLRVKETYSYKHPKLNTDKASFFNPEEVTYVYEHDTIHSAMAHLDRPAYTYFQSGAEVKCERELFDKLPHQTKLYSVLEESYVLALERSQIPHAGKLTPRQSFLIALEKVCTSIASGWWREFAYDHYEEVLDLYSDDYIDKFEKGVDSGKVVVYNKNMVEVEPMAI